MSSGVDTACRLLDALACAWIGVPDPAAAGLIFGDALGLELRDEGGSARLGGGRPVPWMLYAAPGEDRGAVCVFADRARPDADHLLPRGWDCVEAVVVDVDAAAGVLARCPGVRTVRAPFTADLTELGSNLHRSGVWRMPWGTHLILTVGLTTPRDRRFPESTGPTGRVFEVHLRTDRFAVVRRLYSEVLGMPSLMDAELTDGPIHDAWSLPAGAPVAMSFLKSGGRGTGGGAVEIQGHAPALLQPARADGRTPGGTAMITWSAADVDAVRYAVEAAGHRILRGPAVEDGGPFAGRSTLTFAGLEGELLHVVESDPDRSAPQPANRPTAPYQTRGDT